MRNLTIQQKLFVFCVAMVLTIVGLREKSMSEIIELFSKNQAKCAYRAGASASIRFNNSSLRHIAP
jgi:hypothetical protein